jgi:hypothetical protein
MAASRRQNEKYKLFAISHKAVKVEDKSVAILINRYAAGISVRKFLPKTASRNTIINHKLLALGPVAPTLVNLTVC